MADYLHLDRAAPTFYGMKIVESPLVPEGMAYLVDDQLTVPIGARGHIRGVSVDRDQIETSHNGYIQRAAGQRRYRIETELGDLAVTQAPAGMFSDSAVNNATSPVDREAIADMERDPAWGTF